MKIKGQKDPKEKEPPENGHTDVVFGVFAPDNLYIKIQRELYAAGLREAFATMAVRNDNNHLLYSLLAVLPQKHLNAALWDEEKEELFVLHLKTKLYKFGQGLLQRKEVGDRFFMTFYSRDTENNELFHQCQSASVLKESLKEFLFEKDCKIKGLVHEGVSLSKGAIDPNITLRLFCMNFKLGVRVHKREQSGAWKTAYYFHDGRCVATKELGGKKEHVKIREGIHVTIVCYYDQDDNNKMKWCPYKGDLMSFYLKKGNKFCSLSISYL